MTDVADRHWGQSLVRAPTAKAAAHPTGSVGAAPPPPPPAPAAARPPQGADRSPLSGTAVPTPPPAPPLPPAPVRARSAPPTPSVLPWPVTAPVAPPADAPTDLGLARLARGVQDCARALECLADRLDGLERRLDAATTPPAPRPMVGVASSLASATPPAEPLATRLLALEGMATDRLQAFDQRLRRLEILPVAVGRLQQDTVRLSELARAKRLDEGAGDLTSVYAELDSVAEVVAAHHDAANQSLERVRTLERAVLEMGRHLDRNLAEHTRLATTDQAATRGRIDDLERRLAAADLSLRSTKP